MSKLGVNEDGFYSRILDLLKSARRAVVQSVNKTIVDTYFEIGRLIVEEEQNGKSKAEYGQNLITELSHKLTTEFGKGFSTTNLKQMRTFYLTYSKGQTVSDEFRLSWSHYLMLMRIDNVEERKFYEIETIENSWSLRELQRQFDTAQHDNNLQSTNK